MKVKLKEIGKIITGNTPSKQNTLYYNSNDILFIKPDVLQLKKVCDINDSKEFISENARAVSRIVPKGSLLITCIGIIGKIGIVGIDECAFNQQINAIVPNNNIKSKYLAYVLFYNRGRLNDIANAPVVPIINKSEFENFEVNIIGDIKKQESIIQILDKIENIIYKYECVLNYLDTLIKARFVEMFGNINNYKVNIDVKKFKDICTVHQGLQIPISDRKKEPGPNRYKYITIQYLNGKKEEEYIENPNNSVLCKAEDILMTRTGNTGQVVTDVEGCFHNNFFIIDYNKKELNRIFLLTFLRQKEVRDMMVKVATTSTIPDLNHDKFYEIDIPIPTIDLQNTFATFVNQVDKLKVA